MLRVAINGFGRIGRNVLRALYESKRNQSIEVVAINDLGSPAFNAHLIEFDSVHGHFPFQVKADRDAIWIGQDRIEILTESNPLELPWHALQIDVVLECTGRFTSRHAAKQHIDAGAQRVLLSAPGKDVDYTVVYGINDQGLSGEHQIISNASCTTNCLAPLLRVIDQSVGIISGLMTTVHAFTNDQNLMDGYHADWYRSRAAGHSMIPTTTGAAKSIGEVMPEMAGKIDGLAIRVPTANVSIVDLSFIPDQKTTAIELNQRFYEEARQGRLGAGQYQILDFNNLPLVSADFNHSTRSCIVDANHTLVAEPMVKILAWYDNEWGFSHRLLDVLGLWAEVIATHQRARSA